MARTRGRRWAIAGTLALMVLGAAALWASERPVPLSVWWDRQMGGRQFELHGITMATPPGCTRYGDAEGNKNIAFRCGVGPKTFGGVQIGFEFDSLQAVARARPYTESYPETEETVEMVLGPKQGLRYSCPTVYVKRHRVSVAGDSRRLLQPFVQELLRHPAASGVEVAAR